MASRDSFGFLAARAGPEGLQAPARSPLEQQASDAALGAAWEKQGLPACTAPSSANPAAILAAAAHLSHLTPARFKSLARLGVPHNARPAFWLAASGGLAARAAQDDPPSSPSGDSAATAYYSRLATASAGLPAMISHAIGADASGVTLTWRSHPLLSSPSGARAIARIITALMNRNPRLGYARSLAHIAAWMLVVFGGAGSQELVFWTLAGLLETRLFSYCGGQWLLGLRVEQEVLGRLVARKLPRLTSYLAAIRLDATTFTQPWLSSLFVAHLPPETLARVWDCMAVEGAKPLLRVSVALLKMYEQTMLSCSLPDVLRKILELRVSRTNDPAALLSTAFKGIGSLSGEQVEGLRVEAWKAMGLDQELMETAPKRHNGHGLRASASAAALTPAPPALAFTAKRESAPGSGELPDGAGGRASAGGLGGLAADASAAFARLRTLSGPPAGSAGPPAVPHSRSITCASDLGSSPEEMGTRGAASGGTSPDRPPRHLAAHSVRSVVGTQLSSLMARLRRGGGAAPVVAPGPGSADAGSDAALVSDSSGASVAAVPAGPPPVGGLRGMLRRSGTTNSVRALTAC